MVLKGRLRNAFWTPEELLCHTPPPPPQTPAASSPEPSNSCFLFNPLHWITGVPGHVRDSRGHQLQDYHQGLNRRIVEEAENGRDAPANGKAPEENGEQETNKIDEEEVKGSRRKRRRNRKVKMRKRMERKMGRLRQLGTHTGS